MKSDAFSRPRATSVLRERITERRSLQMVHLPLCILTLPSPVLPMETSGRSSLLPNFLKVFSSFPHLKTHLAAEFRILSFLDIINLVPSSLIFIYLFSQNIFSQGLSSLSGYSNSVLFNAFCSNKSSGHPVVIWAVTSLFLQTYDHLREKHFNLLLLLFKDILTS